MICPKCQNVMKTVDKDGIHIEQCEGCRGIFLDRGELEQIVGAENSYYAQATPPPYQPGPPKGQHAPPPPPAPHHGHAPTTHYGHADSPRGYRGGHGGYKDSPKPYRHGYADSPRGYRGGHSGHGGYHDSPRPYGGYGKRRKRSFIENLFD